MSDQVSGEASLAVSLQDLRRVTEVGLERVNGSLALLVQRLDQADERDDHLNKRLDTMTSRVETMERTAVTHGQLDARTSRIYVVVGLVLTALGLAAGVLVPVLTG